MLEALYPYWRYEYEAVAGDRKKAGDNPFANLQKKEARDVKIIAKGATACLILNKYPYAPGHMLALPYRAVAKLEDLTDAETLELQHWVVVGKLLLEKVLKVDGANVGLNQGKIAGGSVPTHLHWHIVPRWEGDHNFMPIIGGTRVLPASQERLRKAFVAAYKKA